MNFRNSSQMPKFWFKIEFFSKKKKEIQIKRAVKHKSGLRQQLLYIFTTLDTDRFFLPIFWNVPVSRDPCWRPAQSFSAHFTTDLCVWLTDTLTWFFALAKRAQKKNKIKSFGGRGGRFFIFWYFLEQGKKVYDFVCVGCAKDGGWRVLPVEKCTCAS